MLNKIIEFSLKQRWLIIVMFLLIAGLGVWCYTLLKVEAYPDLSDTNVIIITKYEGRAAEEVEQQVTIPIERALNAVPHVIDRRSRTIFGLSVVQLNFEEGIDDFYARQVVNEKLASAEVPDGVEPELAPLTTPVGEVFRYVLEASEQHTPMEIRTIHDWVIKPKLIQVQGIADISPFGGPVKQFHVLTSPDKLRRYNMTIIQVMEAIQENNLNTGGNIIVRGGQGFAVRGLGAIKNTEDIEKIVITSVNGVPVYVKDVAEVEIAPPYPSGILGYSFPEEKIDISSGIEGIVLLRRGENPSEVLDRLKNKIKEIEESELPEGIHIRIIYDRSSLVDYTIHTVSHTLMEGITIVVIVLIFFLGSIRSALVVAITIPVSLLFAFIMMKITGIPANLLSLGAIDFGIIVDGACVMAEGVIRRIRNASLEQRKSGIVSFTTKASQEIGSEIFFTVLIIILAYLPLFTLQRVEGRLFSPMAYTLSFALLGALLCSLTIVPVLISFVYQKQFERLDQERKERRNIIIDFLQKIYAGIMDLLMKVPGVTVFVACVLVLVSFFFATRIGTEFLPELDEGSIFLRSFMPSGISIQESAKTAPAIRKIINKHPQVKSVLTQTGRNDDGTDPFGPNRTEVLVELKDYSAWVEDTSKHELIKKIKSELEAEIPGGYFSFGQPIIDQVTEVVTGSAADLAISISGEDLNALRTKADSIVTIVKNIPGASETGIEQEGPQAQLTVEINRQNAARYGINVSDIQTMIEAAIGGKAIGKIYDGSMRFDIVVRFLPEYRNNIDAIRSMLVPSINGNMIPMNQLASIHLKDGQTNIYRLDGKRIITVRTNVRGRDQGSFVAEARTKISSEIHFPKGTSITYGGQFENLQRSGKRLAIVIPLTFLLITILLFILYRNIKDTLITLLCIPFGIVGGVLALLLRGYHFNVSAGVGFVSLFGVSVMAGVLLVSAFNRMQELQLYNLKSAVITASKYEFKPILMMITVAILGLIPAAISKGIGSDIQRPLATVIIGGLFTTLLFTPLVIPSLYYIIERKKIRQGGNN